MHINYQDEQDRWFEKATKISNRDKKLNLEERDPASLSIKEQLELEKKRREAKKNK